jgi:hypothetical protein
LLRRRKLGFEERPEWAEAVVAEPWGETVIRVRPVTFLGDEAGVFEQPEMAGHAGLCQAEDTGQFRDVEAILREHAEEAQPRFVAEEAKERGGIFHIHKSTLVDVNTQPDQVLIAHRQPRIPARIGGS